MIERQHIERVVAALEAGDGHAIDHEVLVAVVEADFSRYEATARVKDFVPVLVERDVRARLRRRRAGGRPPRGKWEPTPV